MLDQLEQQLEEAHDNKADVTILYIIARLLLVFVRAYLTIHKAI